ncbi:MAG: hypothetical protein LIO93_12005 [Bacteroidales bacterium]|nr:hypothetical protein [Bacteroidales bacterium]
MADSTTDKSMMYRMIKQRGTNQLDDLTEGLVNSMRYSDNTVIYPKGEVKENEGVDPEWFLPAYKGTNGFSEMNAIIQYISQEAMFEEIGELMLGISLVEMKHLDKLGDLILDLGGKLNTQKYETTYVAYGTNAKEAVELGIKAEKETIEEYNKILNKVQSVPQNDATRHCLALLAKLIADEQFHIHLFESWLKENYK